MSPEKRVKMLGFDPYFSQTVPQQDYSVLNEERGTITYKEKEESHLSKNDSSFTSDSRS